MKIVAHIYRYPSFLVIPYASVNVIFEILSCTIVHFDFKYIKSPDVSVTPNLWT